MKWDWDYALHFAGGAVCAGVFIPASAWWIPFVIAGILVPPAWMREVEQGPMNLHKHIEAAAWPLGGLAAATLGLVF